MSSVNYDTIFPLIAQANPDGASMRVTFRCPVSGATFESSAGIQASDDLASKAKAGAKRSALWSLRSAVAGAARRALGGGIGGSLASGAAYGATSGVGNQRSYSEEEKKAAIAQAFESVRDQFVWDTPNNRFISAQAAGDVLTEFAQQLGAAPVGTPYDRKVLARMLTEIACADGDLGEEERGFLHGFITPEIGTVEQLAQQAQQARLTPAELAECAPGPSRETMLMLAWSVAFTDESLAPEEEQWLGEFAAGLSIAEPRAQQLKTFAQVYVVDAALGRAYPGGQRDEAAHAWVMDLGSRIGLDPTEAERADIRFRKRYGIA